MKHYVLDACALVAILKDEPGAENVAAALNAAYKGNATISMHRLNLLEVYYDTYRVIGKEQAEIMVSEFLKQPISINAEINDEIFVEAGRLKATYKISLADSVALAEAVVSGGILLSSDHHEFDTIEKSENIRIEWIR
ncbi:MAG: PIN domain-containing protein [Lachnospiraceae bacterium]|jgi:PIN domain nuclease of toxin-antitoxin system|nr:PIN domain-containing protein [Lachnospiraceae bacterium]